MSTYIPVKPQSFELHVFESISISELQQYIDWTPFFLSWELRGKYPQILDDEHYGQEAKKLLHDAQVILQELIHQQSLTVRGVCKIFPANTVHDDDIVLFSDETRDHVVTTMFCLRQQNQKASGNPNLCLADYIAPQGVVGDYLGMFVVSAGKGVEELCRTYEQNHDDYSSIMVKAIADRLAEAAAEWLHQRVRKTIWGYAPQESHSNEELIKEQYQGIRPAPGYPACPEHSEKQKIFQLLEVEKNCGVHLTEHFAMSPAASVCGLYFAHPEAKYFPVGKINRDQVEDYARKKGWTVEEAERWLSPNLGYAVV